MKKIKILLTLFISIFALNKNVYAASGNLITSKTSVYVGDTFTVSVNVSQAAAWNIHVKATGPVSGCIINQADATADALDTNKTFTATCKATSTGTISLLLTGDVTSATNGIAVNVSGNRTVIVTEKPAPTPTPTPKPSTNNNQYKDPRSKNNNLKEISVEGYELIKVDNNNYTLTLPNDITSINVNAQAEDKLAKISGTGTHDINVGENNIEVIVIAENGSQNKINIKVIRKDGYYLEDLDTVLNLSANELNVSINSDTIITAKDLEKIKNSGKTVTFNYYNDEKKLLYSWTINGSKLKNVKDLLTTITNETSNKKDILRLSNYADGLFVKLKQTSDIPNESEIKLFVGTKYENGDVVSVYSYQKENDKIELVKQDIKVEDGYIKFNLKEANDYFVTMSTISNCENSVTKNNTSSPIYIVLIIILSLVVVGLTIFFNKKNKKDKNSILNNNNNNNNNNNLTM